MHRHMAANAFAARLESQAAVRYCALRVESGMALQAEMAGFAPHQEHVVGAAVGIVTGDAPLNFHRGMLVDKRPALLHVALHAGFQCRIGSTHVHPA